MEVVADAGAPHHEADGAEGEGEQQAPEPELGLEVAAAALGDGGDEPVADGSAVEAADEGTDEVLFLPTSISETTAVQAPRRGRVRRGAKVWLRGKKRGMLYRYVDVSDSQGAEAVQRWKVGGICRQLQDNPAESDAVAERAPRHGWVQE